MSQLNEKFLWLHCFEKIGGTVRTDGRTDGQTDEMLGLPVDFAYTDINKKLPYVLYCDKKKEYTGWSKKAIPLF